MLKKLNIILSFIIFTGLITGQAFAKLDAEIISHTIPAKVSPGDVFQVSITVQNTSTAGETWKRPTYRLLSQTVPTNIWGPSQVQLDKKQTVAPGMTATFNMIFTAPATPGIYPCMWQMKKNPGSTFGKLLNLTVEVSDTTPKMLDAAVVSHTIPSVMCAGETRSITITMRNTGSTTTWYTPDFKLFAQNSPQVDDQWGPSQSLLNVGEAIRPGATKTFTVDITAPVTPSSYNCNWQMNITTSEDTRFFGEKLETAVSVVDEGVTCDDGNECTGNGTCIGAVCIVAAPVTDGTACNVANTCTTYICTGGVCGGTINQGASCDDGNNCTTDDTCSAEGICIGSLLDCGGLDDACNLGICNPYTDPPSCELDSTYKNYFACSDGIFCNGSDSCIAGTCILPDGDPCTDDGRFCNGTESCDEGNDQCLSSGNPCVEGMLCNEAADTCDAAQCLVDGDCDDGLYCSGVETCVAGYCQPGTPVDCPDDGVFCNGAESCDEITDACVSSGSPCPPDLICDEGIDICGGCLQDGDCDDGLYCSGAETCVAGNCQTGTTVDCNDSVDCTTDSCDEANDTCIHTPASSICDDGQFCNGNEVCDPIDGCQPGTPVGCPDDGTFCNGAESCDEANDTCSSNGNPCAEGMLCNEDANTCDAAGCSIVADCDDGTYCNGLETCDVGTCIPGTPVNCPSDGLFCNGTESCNEATDSCAGSGNPCTGGTTCNESLDRCVSASTTTTTIPATTTTIPSITTTTIPTAICSVVIAPDTQTVESGGAFEFTAVTTCDGAVVDGTYVWEIVPASTIGSSIAEDTGLFTAGNNTTGSDMTEIVQVTDITHNTIDTAEATVHPVQPVCETAINPSAATIDSEESITFTASTGGTGCLEPDYAWQIDTDLNSQINAGGTSCFYQAGTNKTKMLHTDTLTVVDRANGTSAEVAVTVYYGRIKRIFPKVLFGSRWIPLAHIIYIIGEDTGFNRSSQPVFTPGDSITTIGKIGFRNFMAALVLIAPNAEQELIDLAVPMINEEGQEVTFIKEDMLSIRLLPFGVDEQENKPK